MEQISKDIKFQDYATILKAYFKQEDSHIKSLIVNKNGVKDGKQQLKKAALKEDRLQVKKEAKDIQRTLSCFKVSYALKNDAKEGTSRGSETIFRE
jgi:CRISPR/Cas system CMR-associated protein Cmr5 small subunit